MLLLSRATSIGFPLLGIKKRKRKRKNANSKQENYGFNFGISNALTIAVSMAYSSPVQAAYQNVYKDMAYVSVAPPTVGSGQNVIIAFWCDKLPPTAIGEYGDRFYFDVNIIRPDGTNDTSYEH